MHTYVCYPYVGYVNLFPIRENSPATEDRRSIEECILVSKTDGKDMLMANSKKSERYVHTENEVKFL